MIAPLAPPSLSGSHLRTFNAIHQHPASHNLEWREVRSLLAKLGEITEEANGNLRATRNGQVIVLHPPRTKDVAGMEELMALRHFLARSQEPPAPPADAGETHWLLVIDHREARVFRTDGKGAVPQRILSHAAEDHAPGSPDFSRGQEKPDPNRFFEPVVRALQDSGPILIFGAGTGTASEMDQFVAWVKIHHPELTPRISGSMVVDPHHSTEAQLLAKAREYYAGLVTPLS